MNLSRRVIKAAQVRFDGAETDVTRAAWLPPEPVAVGGGGAAVAPAQTYNPDEVKQALLSSAMVQAQQAVQAAREQAAEIVRTAREEAAAVTAQAKLDGQQAADAEAAQLLLAAHGVLDEVQAWRADLLSRSETAVIDLVAAVARRIFGQGLTLPPEVLQAAFSRALAESKPLGALRMHVHPEDATALGPQWAAAEQASSGQGLELVADPSIRRGGCLLESDSGQVDARVDRQLQVVLDSFESLARTEPTA